MRILKQPETAAETSEVKAEESVVPEDKEDKAKR